MRTIFPLHRNTTIALFLGLFLFLGNSVQATRSDSTPSINITIHKDFQQRKRVLGNKKQLFSIFNTTLNKEEQQALEFLYAYMPLPDLVDYSGEYYKENVDCALRTRQEMTWGKSIPEREWLHFVLPIRVNNENLDNSRSLFYQELKPRVQGMSMYNAALEVNHWCHEKVTYQPSDARTSSPLATLRSAFGRCGEESTFTVAALRSVGIPARQVYTPRWAHTDNNHAWVEVWIDGKWHFLGACEPEAVLDLGWFNQPASRGMLMHTKAFGRYDGPEEVMSRTNCYTEINVTSNYAPVSSVTVKVKDDQGNALKGITVYFKLYNYAEFYNVAQKVTDKNGCASLTAGRGDLLVWAAYNHKFNFKKVSFGKDQQIELIINKTMDDLSSVDMDIVPPFGNNNLPEVSAEQQNYNKKRLAYEDSIRNLYISTFKPKERLQELIRLGFSLNGTQFNDSDLQSLLTGSRGNYNTLTDFLIKNKEASEKAMDLLSILTPKDLRDITQEVLNDNLNHAVTNTKNSPNIREFVLNPRIDNEMLTPYKSFFMKSFSQKERTLFQTQPYRWVEWCNKNIKTDETWNPQSLCMSPQGVFNTRLTDFHSRDIFLVAGLRSFNVPAQIDKVTGKVLYWQNGEWTPATFERDNTKENSHITKGNLQLCYSPISHLQDPAYYTHFTLSKIENGTPRLLEYPEGTNWSTLFKDKNALETGDYMLVTGTRMADGSVLSNLTFFNISQDADKQISLNIRDNTEGVKVIGDFDSETLYYDIRAQRTKSILSTTGRGYYVIGLIHSGQEPSDHALRDIALQTQQLQSWGRPILILFEDEQEHEQFQKSVLAKELNLPQTLSWGIDINHNISKQIIENLKLPSKDSRPIFFIADTFNRVVFAIQGYTIGLGDQMIKTINQLK